MCLSYPPIQSTNPEEDFDWSAQMLIRVVDEQTWHKFCQRFLGNSGKYENIVRLKPVLGEQTHTLHCCS